MSQPKYCQGPKCHEYKTKDRIRGPKDDKHYETRKNSRSFYNDEFCSNMCRDDWFHLHGSRAIDHFGRIHEPKRQDANNSWYKSAKYIGYRNDRTIYNHFFVNDLLAQRISITQEQYNDTNFVSP